jgi:hypothetical protein
LAIGSWLLAKAAANCMMLPGKAWEHFAFKQLANGNWQLAKQTKGKSKTLPLITRIKRITRIGKSGFWLLAHGSWLNPTPKARPKTYRGLRGLGGASSR